MKAVLVALVIIGCLTISAVDCKFKKYKKVYEKPHYYTSGCYGCSYPGWYPGYRPYGSSSHGGHYGGSYPTSHYGSYSYGWQYGPQTGWYRK